MRKERTKKKIGLKALPWSYTLLSLAFFIFFVCAAGFSKEEEDFLEVIVAPQTVNQGEICVVNVRVPEGVSSLRGVFRNREFPFYEVTKGGSYRALVGLDLETTPGAYQLTIFAGDATGNFVERNCRINVLKKEFRTQRLTLPTKMVELDGKTAKRAGRESEKVKKVWKEETTERMWHEGFLKPVDGKVLSPFGVRRVLNDSPRSPHSGVDLRAKMGEDIRCSNTGIVVLTDDLFFSGKSVVVDHGQGLYTMYFHLSQIGVREGQRVGRGEVLGQVGSSGRATGPHLHWGVRLHGARVDPFSLLRLR